MINDKIMAIAPMLTLSNTKVAQPAPSTHVEKSPFIDDEKAFQNFSNTTSYDFTSVLFAVGVVLGLGYTVIIVFSKTLDLLKGLKSGDSTRTDAENHATFIKQLSTSNQIKIDSTAYVEKAYTALRQVDVQQALAELNKAICVYPDDAHLYIERANIRRKNLGDMQGALEDYTHAITLKPNNALYYLWRSKVYHEAGEQSKAMDDYNTAIRLAPHDTMYHCFTKN